MSLVLISYVDLVFFLFHRLCKKTISARWIFFLMKKKHQRNQMSIILSSCVELIIFDFYVVGNNSIYPSMQYYLPLWKGGISIDADCGPPRQVLSYCRSICQEDFTFIQIGSGHTVLYLENKGEQGPGPPVPPEQSHFSLSNLLAVLGQLLVSIVALALLLQPQHC